MFSGAPAPVAAMGQPEGQRHGHPIASRADDPEVVARVERRVLGIGPVEGEPRDSTRTAPRTQM